MCDIIPFRMTTEKASLTCSKCLRSFSVPADEARDAVALANKEGWSTDRTGERVICPVCAPRVLFTCPCGHKRNLKPGDVRKYCPMCQTMGAA